MAEAERVRLCVDTHAPLDPGNYPGRPHCIAHQEGHACVTALYERVPDTTVTDAERHGHLPKHQRPTEPWASAEGTQDA